jgi:hypothetical protein
MDMSRPTLYRRAGRWPRTVTKVREDRRVAPARTPDEAAERLRRAGFRIAEPTRKTPIRPIDVPGLDLSKGLDEARGKRSR